MKRALVLGGTTEAREVSSGLVSMDWSVTLALKGLTSRPGVPEGVTLRSGSFGGPKGLADYLKDEKIDLLIDATHPFAANMSWNAKTSSDLSGVPAIAVQRPAWKPRPGDRWLIFDTLTKAARRLRFQPTKNVLLALGGQGAEGFRGIGQHRFQARVLSSSKTALATSAAHRWRGLSLIRVATQRTLAEEMAGMRDFKADLMIVRNAGGAMDAKLEAARRLRLPVWVIARPAMPPMPTFSSSSALLSHLGHDRASP